MITRGPTLGEQVYGYIRERIVSGFYRPGEVLVESELAQALRVSRTPVSNAVIMLKERGLIEERGGKFVTLDLSIGDVIDLYQCRLAFDGLAARLAAGRVSSEKLGQLESLLDAWGVPAGETDSQALWVADLSFHALIYEVSGNRHLIRFSEIASDLLSTYRRVILENLSREDGRVRTQAVVRGEHEHIFVALASGDSVAAEGAARTHIGNVIVHLESIRGQTASSPFERELRPPSSQRPTRGVG